MREWTRARAAIRLTITMVTRERWTLIRPALRPRLRWRGRWKGRGTTLNLGERRYNCRAPCRSFVCVLTLYIYIYITYERERIPYARLLWPISRPVVISLRDLHEHVPGATGLHARPSRRIHPSPPPLPPVHLSPAASFFYFSSSFTAPGPPQPVHRPWTRSLFEHCRIRFSFLLHDGSCRRDIRSSR